MRSPTPGSSSRVLARSANGASPIDPLKMSISLPATPPLPNSSAQHSTPAETALTEAGYEVTRSRVSDSFARFHLHGQGHELLDVDFGINWRSDAPAAMTVGPVLSERDAIAGKLSAVYSRGEVRDFLDLDSIRATGRFTDAELLALGREHDNGFDTNMFAEQLSRIATILPTQAAKYGVTANEFAEVQGRTLAWVVELRNTPNPPHVGISTPGCEEPSAQ
jgi:hypothetical protein